MEPRRSLLAFALCCLFAAANLWGAETETSDSPSGPNRGNLEVESREETTLDVADLQEFREVLRSQDHQIRELKAELDEMRENRAAGAAARVRSTFGGLQPAGVEQTSRAETGPQLASPAFLRADEQGSPSEEVDVLVQRVLARLEAEGAAAAGPAPKFETGYDRGFFIRPTPENKDDIPFDLKMNGRMQFRHIGFKDDTGATSDRNDFEVERGRLIFDGHFIDPKLRFYMQIDGDDDDNFDLKFHDFILTYAHSEAFNISFGKWKVPGSRDWLESSQRLRFADRSMATTFFRPDRTTGVWFHGEPAEGVFYNFNIGNGFFTTDLTPAQIDDNFGFAGSLWWEPWGDFGPGYSDLECHECAVIRLGNSFAFADMDRPSLPGEENAFRLVDSGTRLVDAFPGANGAAAGFDVWLYSLDFAWKYSGWSFTSEYFLRWLQDFEGSNVPPSDIFDHGYFVEGGYFVVPETIEAIARVSRVINDGGSPSADEYAAGFNWFFKGHNLKLTFDVSVLNGSPASSSSPNYRAGDDGVLFRTQVDAGF
jgi:phosphate-selective porin